MTKLTDREIERMAYDIALLEWSKTHDQTPTLETVKEFAELLLATKTAVREACKTPFKSWRGAID